MSTWETYAHGHLLSESLDCAHVKALAQLDDKRTEREWQGVGISFFWGGVAPRMEHEKGPLNATLQLNSLGEKRVSSLLVDV